MKYTDNSCKGIDENTSPPVQIHDLLVRLVRSKTFPNLTSVDLWPFSPDPRIKLTLEGVEEEEDDEEQEQSAVAWHKMTTTLETSMISGDAYKSRHSQPECGYALEASQWTEYVIHTMDPDNLELTFDFFEVQFTAGWLLSTLQKQLIFVL